MSGRNIIYSRLCFLTCHTEGQKSNSNTSEIQNLKTQNSTCVVFVDFKYATFTFGVCQYVTVNVSK